MDIKRIFEYFRMYLQLLSIYNISVTYIYFQKIKYSKNKDNNKYRIKRFP